MDTWTDALMDRHFEVKIVLRYQTNLDPDNVFNKTKQITMGPLIEFHNIFIVSSSSAQAFDALIIFSNISGRTSGTIFVSPNPL